MNGKNYNLFGRKMMLKPALADYLIDEFAKRQSL